MIQYSIKESGWLNANDQNSLGETISEYIKEDILGIVADVGNIVFFVIAAFLGVKYIWSGVSGKSEVKETLPTFIVGATFFYSGQLIFDLFNGEFETLFINKDLDYITGSIWTTVVSIVQILSIAGIIAVGLKYMLAPADKRADLKKDLSTLLIGLIMVFSLSNVMSFIANVGHDLFQ